MVQQRFFDEEEEEESDDASESGEDEEVQEEVKKEDGSDDESEDDDDDDEDEEDADEDDEGTDNNKDADEATKKGTADSANKPKSSMSRRSRKKLEKFAADKTKRRTMETERRKRRAAEIRDMQEKNPEAEIEGYAHKKKRLKQNKMENSQCKLRVAVDCGFDALMDDNEISRLCKQIQMAYMTNRRLANPLQLYATGLDGESRVKKKFDEVYLGSANWDIFRKSESVKDVFTAEEIVYLSNDSDNVIEKLDDGKVYVIRGLAGSSLLDDRAQNRPCSTGLAHARFPFDEGVEAPSLPLSVSRSFRAIANFSQNGGDWKKALADVILKLRADAKEVGGGDQKPGQGGGGGGGGGPGGAMGVKKKKRTKRGGKKHRKNNTQSGAAKVTVADVNS